MCLVCFPAGNTALHQAAIRNHAPMVCLLNDSRMDVNARNDHGLTALHIAAMRDSYKSLIGLLVHGCVDQIFLGNAFPRPGRRTFTTSLFGDTAHRPIIVGASKESTEDGLKVRGELDVNARDLKEGNTALHLAVASHSFLAIQILLDEPRVDVDARNKCGKTARDMALEQRCYFAQDVDDVDILGLFDARKRGGKLRRSRLQDFQWP